MRPALPKDGPGMGVESVERRPVRKPYNGRGYVLAWFLVGTFDLWVGVYGLGAGRTPWFPMVLVALGVGFLISALNLQLRWDEYDNQKNGSRDG